MRPYSSSLSDGPSSNMYQHESFYSRPRASELSFRYRYTCFALETDPETPIDDATEGSAVDNIQFGWLVS